MKKIVIFDLDGTLIDSLPDISDSLNSALKSNGYETRSEKEIMQFIGNGARKLVERALPDGLDEQEIVRVLGIFNRIYTSSGSPKTKVFCGMDNVLQTLKSRGYLLGIITNKPQMATDGVYATYLKDFGFDMVIGQREEFPRKPDPSSVNFMLDKLGVEAENAYFVGDGETDVETAINARANGVAVLWGYRSRAQLETAGAKIFANIPQDLLNIIL